MVVFELDIPSLYTDGILMRENVFSGVNEFFKGIERIEIYDSMNRFVIDGLNELKSVIIKYNSFALNKKKREGSKCVIMNCDQLNEICFGSRSFWWYESFELKNLPSLISIQLNNEAFEHCHSIVFESKND